jgi:hypothetical protein
MCGADILRPPPKRGAELAGAVVTGVVIAVVSWRVAEFVGLPPEPVAFDAHPASTAVETATASTAPTARRGFIRLTVDRQTAETG